MKKILLMVLAAGLLLGACGYPRSLYTPMYDGYDDPRVEQYGSNGELIYFTAFNQNREYIPHTGGPVPGGMMMNSYLTCASCHGADGRGGTHTMHMQVMDAPPIHYSALVEMMQEESENASPMEEYTLEAFRQAVVEGRHPDGDEMDRDMPRWKMSDSDLADLLIFLKTLP